jgi:hypothetical protein
MGQIGPFAVRIRGEIEGLGDGKGGKHHPPVQDLQLIPAADIGETAVGMIFDPVKHTGHRKGHHPLGPAEDPDFRGRSVSVDTHVNIPALWMWSKVPHTRGVHYR